MPEEEPGAEILQLSDDFPPVPTAQWEAAIRRDLKDADYEKTLVWRTEEGIPVRPYYRSESLEGLEHQTNTPPGQFPFVRGQVGRAPSPAASAPAGQIRADHFHEAGATAVQELAYALASGVESLSARIDAGATVDDASAGIRFVFSIGSNFFFEIAKLRAMRMLWAQIVSAFGPADENACIAQIHARTARANKSVYDPYTNLLRATTEAMSAVAGGCQSLEVEPFGFDEHLAVNVERILAEESHFDSVPDPAGGSYYIEALTDALAREAWRLFQQIEDEGGWTKALAAGSIEHAIGESRAAKQKAVATRRQVLVGVNNYPDLKEKAPQVLAPAADKASPFPQWRMAEPFERIRERTARHARATGRLPKVLLIKRGDVKMRRARANFCLNLFGCGGFDIAESDTVEKAAADLIVLCSSDSEYAALAREICPKVHVPVLVAGNPEAHIDELKASGVQGFVHVRSNAVETLTDWQNRLGMEE